MYLHPPACLWIKLAVKQTWQLPVSCAELFSPVSGLSVVWHFPTASSYNSSSVPGGTSWHTRRRTSPHSPTHATLHTHCAATFCWALLCAWQAKLGGKQTGTIKKMLHSFLCLSRAKYSFYTELNVGCGTKRKGVNRSVCVTVADYR